MGNCLVTKLKGVVDNDNLKKLGAIRLAFLIGEDDNTHQHFIQLPRNLGAEDMTLRVINVPATGSSGLIELGDNTFKLTANNNWLAYVNFGTSPVSETYAIVEVSSKYALKVIAENMEKVDEGISELLYSHSIDWASIQGLLKSGDTISMSELATAWPNLVYLNCFSINGELTGVISDFYPLAATLKSLSLNNSHILISGNVKEFSKLPLLEVLALYTCTTITGDFEGLAAYEVAYSARNEGSVAIGWGSEVVNFKGVASAKEQNQTFTWAPNAVNNSYIDVAIDSNETTISVDAQGNWSYVNQDKSKYTG